MGPGEIQCQAVSLLTSALLTCPQPKSINSNSILKHLLQPCVAAHTSNPKIWEAKTGRLLSSRVTWAREQDFILDKKEMEDEKEEYG